jgi:hypothetical protein
MISFVPSDDDNDNNNDNYHDDNNDNYDDDDNDNDNNDINNDDNEHKRELHVKDGFIIHFVLHNTQKPFQNTF